MWRYPRAGLRFVLFRVPWLLLPLMPILAFALWICGIGWLLSFRARHGSRSRHRCPQLRKKILMRLCYPHRRLESLLFDRHDIGTSDFNTVVGMARPHRSSKPDPVPDIRDFNHHLSPIAVRSCS